VNAGRCAVGLLTWNGEADVAACVRALQAQSEPALDVIWIDNGSTDGTVSRVREAARDFPEPRRLAANIGFCAGHNLGLSLARLPYYLALNQDVALAPDYIGRLCDWLDEDSTLAATSGLLLQTADLEHLDPAAPIASAGLAMGYGRFPFELGMDRSPGPSDSARRYVPGVTGAAMLLRRSAVQALTDSDEFFPADFFAYFEEVDLALRLARAGWRCGLDGAARAWHARRGHEGRRDPRLRVHYLKNHWLVSLRNDAWSELLREAPYVLKGELRWYFPRYLRTPWAALQALGAALVHAPRARRVYQSLERRFPEARAGRAGFYALSRSLLRGNHAHGAEAPPAGHSKRSQ